MIVADTNTIAYLYLPTDFTSDVEALLEIDSNWVAPILWRSEFRNILALYIRKSIIDLETALQMQLQAEQQLAGNEYTVNSNSVLSLAKQSSCSAYDCEFVSIAKTLDTTLITVDKKLIKAFPDIAMTPRDYMSTLP
ncbi:type II toxin-antitoxin system VapC family toxin [Ketobacter sp. MCCC 1A13808]|uniref:type II toxin-antitoxin system VapC family toxin n=1 Tax=Ketobacter sp. MCCC 1A13808 TaxID=2602738 RepID=UPI0012EB5AF5|nr:type II toxin-antitoxin system VapC family toxin [Ketobacter sp. MCCC 1A13808]MVF13394.1 type II toxin-antitoxin system VapC family toxin [Ketobacter sp. MCCC 1A13808]